MAIAQLGGTNNYVLTFYTVGQGSVLPGNSTYPSGTTVNLTAIVAEGWSFTGWTGAVYGTGNTTLLMDGNKTVYAVFVPNVNVNFNALCQGDCFVQIDALPGTVPTEYYVPSTSTLNFSGNAGAYQSGSPYLTYYIANDNVSATGTINAAWGSYQNISVNLYSTSSTSGFFVPGNFAFGNQILNDCFMVGCNPGPTLPQESSALGYTGSYVDSVGTTHSVQGYAAFYASTTGSSGSEVMVMLVMLLNPDGSPLMTIFWCPTATTLPFNSSLTVQAANPFQHAITVQPCVSTLNYSAQVAGECVVGPGLGPVDPNYSYELGQGSFNISGLATAELYAPTPLGAIYVTEDGVSCFGTFSDQWNNTTVDVRLYATNSRGAFSTQSLLPNQFIVGMWPSDTGTPLSTALTYNGTMVDSTGNHTISGYAVAAVIIMGNAESTNAIPTPIGAIWLFNADNSSMKAFAWFPENVTGSSFPSLEGQTINAATTFESSVLSHSSLTMYSVGQGTVLPGNAVYQSDTTVNLQAIPAQGWSFSGWSGDASGTANTTITMTGNKTVTATFTINTYTITVTQSANGTIAPNTSTVNYGSDQVFNITANAGYHIADVLVNGVPAGGVTSYTFSNVTSNGNITALFASNANTTSTINAIQSNNPSNVVAITLEGNITAQQIVSNVTITPNQSNFTTSISFTITGENGTMGFSNMTIAKSAISYGSTPIVYIDGVQATNQSYTQDANNYYVWFTTHFSTHQVTVQFTVPASSASPDWTIYIIASVVAVIALIAVVGVIFSRKKSKPKNSVTTL